MNFVEMRSIPHKKWGKNHTTQQKGLWEIQIIWAQKTSKNLHEGQVKKGELMSKGR
jgi:hypothetical protein